ncbi:DUF1671 domain protein [Aspergillus heteromorphus CBS 117.55]|uniref:DUF1671 domain protein n=1 Tax=Aspergillus heteromorphus CBS 117.55 TaxID=1448321 RepID=A0A317USL9_9EURO|nr:DUF1671 domain protein [Aspergillus heteromorphus CBS 117.55]PWY64994.1 DUF1671 domain protein [Aspergillus heteromorphus CBS 117.55]
MDHSDSACPFCSFSNPDSSVVAEHVETCHPEDNMQVLYGAQPANMLDISPKLQQSRPSHDKEECPGGYTGCPHGCGEIVTDAEISSHLDLHFAESVALEDMPALPVERRTNADNPPQEPGATSQARLEKAARKLPIEEDRSGIPWVQAGDSKTMYSSGMKRLGRTELGPHAHEKQMPSWLRKMLERNPRSMLSNTLGLGGTFRRHETVENETSDVIPVLARLCEQDNSVQRAFFCSPAVHQISKIPREGGFCGYRNIQMLISYMKETRMSGHECFPGDLPTIFELQDMIEDAWDKGFNAAGRIETGGIRGTRKYIGTPEALALFSSLEIQCEANSIGTTNNVRAHDALFMNIASYFRNACSLDGRNKVIQTSLPPIYFQHQGHSLTIIGFEVRDNGSADLLVFDPMFKAPPAVKRLKGTKALTPDPERILKGYRRGTAYLQKYKTFELLKIA